ncbi:hypothetical protein P43SY_009807 [Pythium insidiosum]|uniref:Uncharacterized protein n=1 Tax=Pythium insidiosum TaxID=114742 RepID=A0AAD5Q2Z0_PYTIN|nr:hypothetical protein P43SY_009807 [Pythium insidiosum]
MASHVNGLLKCPELLLRGHELVQRGAALQRLEKKGKRFESPWHVYTVAIYAGVLFYYDDVSAFPHGVKQAMELAEIARNLQLTFQNDVLMSKQISSTNSSAATGKKS